MAFIFSTSHLPEFGHPAAEEEEEDVQPMPRAGGVRAFSHLPQPVRAQADFPEAGRDSSPRRQIPQIPPRSTTPAFPAPPKPEEHDTPPAPEPSPEDAPQADSAPHVPEDSSPWYMPRISANDLSPQEPDEDPPGFRLNRPDLNSGFDDTPLAAPSPSSTHSSGSPPSRKTFATTSTPPPQTLPPEKPPLKTASPP